MNMNPRWKLMAITLVLVVLLAGLLATYAAGQEPGTDAIPHKEPFYDSGPFLVNPRAGGIAVTRQASPLAVQTFTSQDTPIDIPDYDPGDPQCITSTITVADPLQFADLDVGLNISHTWRADLEIWLTAPNGQASELLTRIGQDYDHFNVLLDDESAYDPRNWPANDAGQAADHDYTLPTYEWTWFSEGMYLDPGPPLHTLYPGQAQGDWHLRICDALQGDMGMLNEWELHFSELAGPYLYDSYKMGPEYVLNGAPLTYTLVLTNSLGSAASAVLTDPIPADTYLVPGSLTCDAGTCAYDAQADAITWAGNIAAGAPVALEFAVGTVGVTCGSQIVNSAVLTDPALDLGPVQLEWSAWAWDLQPYHWDFEAGDGGFTGTNDWEWGTPTYPPHLGAHSGTKAWATVLDGGFTQGPVTSILTRTLDLSTYYPDQQLTLSWWHFLEADTGTDKPFSYARVKIDGTEVYSIYQQGPVNTVTWIPANADISAHAGSEVVLEFEFFAYGVSYAGWYLDDISIFGCQAPEILHLEPSVANDSGCPLEDIVYNFQAVNTSIVPQTVDFRIEGGTFVTSVEPEQLTIGQGQQPVTVTVHIPPQPGGTFDLVHLVADGETNSDTATIQTTIGDKCKKYYFNPYVIHYESDAPRP